MRLALCAVLALWCSVAAAEPISIAGFSAKTYLQNDDVLLRVKYDQPLSLPSDIFLFSFYEQQEVFVDHNTSSFYSSSVSGNTIALTAGAHPTGSEIIRVPFTLTEGGSLLTIHVPYSALGVDSGDFLFWTSVTRAGDGDGGYQQAEIASVPEPSTWAMMAGAGILFWRRRRA